jgi:hypothetical protein
MPKNSHSIAADHLGEILHKLVGSSVLPCATMMRVVVGAISRRHTTHGYMRCHLAGICLSLTIVSQRAPTYWNIHGLWNLNCTKKVRQCCTGSTSKCNVIRQNIRWEIEGVLGIWSIDYTCLIKNGQDVRWRWLVDHPVQQKKSCPHKTWITSTSKSTQISRPSKCIDNISFHLLSSWHISLIRYVLHHSSPCTRSAPNTSNPKSGSGTNNTRLNLSIKHPNTWSYCQWQAAWYRYQY